MGKSFKKKICTLFASTMLSTTAIAQTSPHPNVDANGVDVTTGMLSLGIPIASIGTGQARLPIIAYDGVSDNWTQINLFRTASNGRGSYTVSLGQQFDTFGINGGASLRGTGAVLTVDSAGSATYAGLDGVIITFGDPTGMSTSASANICNDNSGLNGSCFSLPLTMAGRTGMEVSFDWATSANCANQFNDDGTVDCTFAWRLAGVSNDAGYAINWSFATNNVGNHQAPAPDWFRRTSAQLTNGNASASSWPTVTYGASSNLRTITMPSGGVWQFTGGAPNIAAVRFPGRTTDNLTIAYGSYGQVSSVTKDGVATRYARTVSGNTATMIVTDAMNTQTRIVSDMSLYRPTSVTGALGQTTTFSYDAIGRLTETIYPEGNRVDLGYDSRGNLTSITRKAKPGSSLSDIVTTAHYPDACSDASCNSPTWTQDANGNRTDYAYNADGMLTSVTSPAGTNGIRPQTRYTYAKVSGVSMPITVSACRTSSSCSGAADENRTTIAYNANLQPTSVSSGAGDGSLSATNTVFYDNIGNVAAVDGPLAGSADTTNYAWDADRRLISVTGADPDGPGPLRRRQVVNHYILDGVADSRSVGTADADGNNFQALQTVTLGFDGNGRKVSSTLTAGGTTFGVTHYGYDALGRLRCMAVRMNTGRWTTPTDACTAQAAGAYGADRIAQVKYDQVGRPRRVISAAGTPEESDEDTTYTPNGQVATRSDAMFNLTTNVYDGFDRLVQRRFPSTTQGSSTSDAGNYESYGYDANGNLTSRRLRDGNSYTQSFDALDRLTNDGQSHSYSYDNVGHLTSGTDTSGTYENFGWDALGRKTSENAKFGGTATMRYDAAGRRTRLTWADGFFVTYDYDMLGEMTGIHENGGTLLAGFAYDDLGRRTSLTRANGTGTGYGYDGASRLTGLSLNGGPANGYTFAYTPAGQIARRTSANDAFAWTGAVNTDRGYTTNGLNQYTQSGGVTPTYDGRGNLTSAGGATYGYDLQNRLTTFSGGYIYRNAFGQWLDVNTERQWMVHDDDRTIAEFGYDGTVHRRYVYGPGTDEPLVWYEGAGTNDRRFLHADERGSIVAVSDSGGGTIAINSYDEYGIPGANNVGRFQYTGQRWIPALGMYDYKARMYSPTLGRFLQTDPIGYGDGMNWYNYVGGDPVNATDPSGTCESLVAGVYYTWHFADGSSSCNASAAQLQTGISNYFGSGNDILVVGNRGNGGGGLFGGNGSFGFGASPSGGSSIFPGNSSAGDVATPQSGRYPTICQRRDWHDLKVSEQVAALRAAGFSVAENVRIARFPSLPSSYAVADYIARAPGSTPLHSIYYLGEVKTGDADLTPNQRINYYSGLTQIRSSNAEGIGLLKNEVIPVVWNGVDRFPGCPRN